jgi:hypothetical protein
MKVMFFYPNNEGYFRCPIGLTLIMTILAKEGYEVKLFDTTFMASAENIDTKYGPKDINPNQPKKNLLKYIN